MKLKFFITIFFVLIVTALSISAIHFHFFKQERLRLIELNLQQNVSLIMDNDLTLTKKEFLKIGDDYIQEIIGDDKINIIVAIYNGRGKLLYENDNALIFNIPTYLPTKFHEWEDVETKEYLIKYLTVKDKVQDRIVRVGMILNQSLIRWRYLSQRVFIYAAIILVFITILSYFLTSLLFRPIHALANHVNAMATKLETGDTNDFQFLFHVSTSRYNDDEFSALLKSIHKLSLKIMESHNITKKWSAMMAHELKTPLTILKNRVESLSLEAGSKDKKIALIDEEMARMENIIEDFLQWASFESDPAKPEIHAVSIKKRCHYILENLQKVHPEAKIVFNETNSNDLKVFCNPIHFDQMLSNLVVNSIKYGKGDIVIDCQSNGLVISDSGPGIPQEVLEKLGTPFNHANVSGTKGCGLGLAWVNTICRKYNWQLSIDNQHGNRVQIIFLSSLEDEKEFT